ncbi:hypothetical protein KC960_01870 [Candidatus Saccharibacteria bacterium]|nr:hypothetical protein [Candidatus Saccharibacteria bacterium]
MTNKAGEQTESVNEKTLKELRRLNRQLADRNSKKQTFIRGIYRGVGAAIGATVIAAIVLSALSFSIEKLENVPVLDTLIEKFNLNEGLEQR